VTTLKDVLAAKRKALFEATGDMTIKDALAKMAVHNVGSLIVRERGRLVGIITERHFARKVYLAGLTSPDTKVGDVMSTDVVVAGPTMPVEEALAIMAAKGCRHLPVCEGNDVIGMVTMTDLVRSLVGDREFTITQLQQYVYGGSDP
jgi:CBS domain-containing protein